MKSNICDWTAAAARAACGTALVGLFAWSVGAQTTTTTYHFHQETTGEAGALLQLKTSGPDSASYTSPSGNLQNQPAGEYGIRELKTYFGSPSAVGTIPSGSTLSFTVWMAKSANYGTLFPRIRGRLNFDSGALLCQTTGTSPLTTTLTAYTLSCVTNADVTLAVTDRIYLWSGVNMTAGPGNHGLTAQMAVEGTLNGNYDSRFSIPLPSAPYTLTAVNPITGLVGQSVTISGSGFGAAQGDSTVTFNGVPATVTNWAPASVVALVPTGARTGPVVVRSSAGHQSNGIAFTVITPPAISILNPTSSTVGQSIRITGSAFGASQGSSAVTFNSAAASVTYWSDTIIDANVPAGATGGPVLVTVNGYASNAAPFVVITPPAGGPVSTYHLHKESSTTSGMFQLKTAGPDATTFALQTIDLKNLSGTEYVIKEFDTQANDPSAVGVISQGATLAFTLWMKKTAAYSQLRPRVRVKLNNASGVTLCEATSTTDLTTTLSAYALSCTPTTSVAFSSADRLYLWMGVTMNGSPGNHSLKAELDVEGTLNGNYDSRFMLPGFVPPPTITSLSPSSGSIGQTVTITGTHFGPSKGVSTVLFNNGIAAIPTAWSETSITVPVPAGATTGPVAVTVFQSSNSAVFTVLGVITGNVTQGGGTPVAAATVQALQSGQVIASTTTTAGGTYTLPNLVAGSYDVTVSAAGYGSQSKSSVVVPPSGAASVSFALSSTGAVAYTYDALNRLTGVVNGTGGAHYTYDAVGNVLAIEAAAAGSVGIVSISPTSGPVGSTVTITGSGFGTQTGDNTVRFNGTVATALFNSATRVIAAVPAGATTGPVTVTTVVGSAATPEAFVVTSTSGVLTISGFTPAIGAPGAAVTVTGTGFYEPIPISNIVTFNTAAGSATSVTPSSLVATIPPSATSGHMTVTAPSGSATSTADFFVAPAPYTAADVMFTGRTTLDAPINVPFATGRVALIVFDAQAGQRVSIRQTDITGSLSVKCDFVQPDGVVIFPNGYPTVLPMTGTYTVAVSPFQPENGSVTITISPFFDITDSIFINGPGKTAQISIPFQVARFTFGGVAGEAVFLYDSAWPNCNSSTRLYSPSGATLTVMQPCYASTVQLTLPTTGVYTLEVSALSWASTATANLSLYTP